MVKTRLVLVLFICTIGSVSTAATQTEKALLHGRVQVAGSGAPVPGVLVTANGIEAVQGQRGEATTGNEGRFTLALQAGRYRVSAARPGFVTQPYGIGRIGSPVNLEAGRPVEISINLVPTGTVTGRIFDAAGQPLEGMIVAMEDPVAGTDLDLQSRLRTSRTDDRGEYRLYWVPPGEYRVIARTGTISDGIVFGAARIPSVAVGENYMPTYFPGTYDPSHASLLRVSPGVETRGIDFSMTKARTTTVRGRVMSPAVDITGAVVQVSMRPLDAAVARIAPPPSIIQTGRADFQATRVLPGRYRIIATMRIPNQRNLTGEIYLDVNDQLLENVTVPVVPSVTLRGVVRFDDSPTAAREALANKKPVIAFQSEIGGSFMSSSAEPNPDGTFVARDIGIGKYRVSVLGLPPDFYLSSALLGGVDVMQDGFQIQGEPNALIEVSVSGLGGRIEGRVRAGQDFGSDYTVLLAPEPRLRDRPELFKRVTANQYGQFSIRGIPPGHYKLFAFQDLAFLAAGYADAVARIEPRGKPVRVEKNDIITLELEN